MIKCYAVKHFYCRTPEAHSSTSFKHQQKGYNCHMTRQSETGKLGEDIAVRFLKKNRYRIVERNYREKWGEIDIIALSPQKVLVFVEVKAVTGPDPYVEPEEHLTRSKLARLQRTAELYANSQEGKLIKRGWRIDLLAITISGENAEVKHYENI